MTSGVVVADGLRRKVLSGLGWKILSQIVAQGSRTVVGIALAHLLTPREFGLAAMALVFTGIASIFTDLSLGAALVQQPTITEDDRSTVFWTTLGAGVAMTAVGIGLAPVAALFFSTPAVKPLFAATAGLAFLSAIAVTQMALLTREMNFRSLELREMVSTVIGAAAGIGMAFAGAGAWAIVGQALCTAAISAVLVWRLTPWRPTRRYSRASLRTLGSFGGKTLAARLMGYANMNTDNLLIGRYRGQHALGVYAVAYNVMFLPMGRIAAPIQQVLYPAFVKLQDDPTRLGRAWVRGNALVTAVIVPVFLGTLVVAPDFVPVVLGSKWHEAVPVLQLLSLAGAVHSFQTLNWSVLQAIGRPGLLLSFMIFSCAVTVGGFAIGLHWGIVGVAASFAIARTILTLAFGWITCRAIAFPQGRLLASGWRVLSLALTMAAFVYLTRLGLVQAAQIPTAARLLVLVLLGLVVYLGLVAWRAPDLVEEARALFRRDAASA